jgi:glycosyltransferase involved in cell wall biosynthesis
MRVCNIIQCANLGGMEHSSLLLLKYLQDRGHEVEFLSLQPLGGIAPLLAHHSIPAEGLAYRGTGGWRSIRDFRRRIRRTNCDALIMTGHNLLATEALGGFCADRRILSIHFHHAGVKPLWQWRLIYRSALAKFSAIVFPSDFIREEAEAIVPAMKGVSHTVGCPIELWAPPTLAQRLQARQILGLPQHARIVGNAGWIIPRKRFDIFLKVARNLAAANPDTIFVIAGDGPEADAMKSLSVELGIADRVRWLGWQADLKPFYQSLDLLLFNSDWDAMGRTPLEALAFGVPAVASILQGGLQEILTRESYRPLFTTHDIDEMTNAALLILNDGPTASRVVDAGRRQLERLASPSRYMDRVCEIVGISTDMERSAAE